jgi:hypothetical protein
VNRALFFSLVLLLATAPAWADTRRVEGLEFDRVVVKGGVMVEISQGDAAGLILRGAADDLEREPFLLSGSTLVLGADRSGRLYDDVQYKVTVVKLGNLQLKGSGEVYVKPLVTGDLYAAIEGSGDLRLFSIEADDVTLQVSGSGDLQLASVSAEELSAVLSGSGGMHFGEVELESMVVSIMGSGDVTAKGPGRTDGLDVNVIGSGNADLGAVVAREVEANVIGSGSARVHATAQLEVNILGGGILQYQGGPDLETSVIGSGDVQRIE